MQGESRYDLMIFTDWFLPASKAGGPISSINNLVEQLKSAIKVLIVTSDRDLGDEVPFKGIKVNQRIEFKTNVDLYYLDAEHQTKSFYKSLIDQYQPKSVYLNSMFSYRFSFIPVRLLVKNYPDIRTVLAPRGMLHPNALKIKTLKKKLFLTLFKWSAISDKIQFQATDQNEKRYIKNIFGQDSVLLANSPFIPQRSYNRPEKKTGELHLITSSRVSHEKNTVGLYKMLSALSGDLKIKHTLIGPSEKPHYWGECEILISSMPENVSCQYLGPLDHSSMLDEIEKAHAFILPTLGENFGHSIFEALSLGKPLVISNLTPWVELEEKGIGWNLALDDEKAWQTSIEKLANMDNAHYTAMSESARDFAQNYVIMSKIKERYLKLFELQDRDL